ncbi:MULTISPECIES: GNAT family protein [unclassified Sinorhizobium]|uniref:GNAT family N-acetyltransferase n=1 Tax=unclassified Sinorhizobium TaxID=2613772 RepID=UPI0024C4593E|nr:MULTISPECIES: GNAT family protein [unclassified Sinorhizobium]MDK1374302.1 GNAT family protein [Sinorhizobium sp. 6-70]MDK1479446.1 GNAT family protein [Sinorhizobium sp. 6-117]
MTESQLQLHNFAKEHARDLPAWFPTLQSLIQWGGPDVRFPLDKGQIEGMVAETSGFEAKRWIFSGLVRGVVAGHAQVALDWQNGVARLSRVAVNPLFRGQGLARPFLRLVVQRVFAAPVFERLELNVYTFNGAAIRTYLGLGFIEEGVRRSSVKVGDERWDTAIYGLLRSELPEN